jgi:hypothetical protein
MKIFDRFRDTPWSKEADVLSQKLSLAVYQVTRMAAGALSIDWDSLDGNRRECATLAVASLYIHWLDRFLFNAGGDRVRTAVGEFVVARLVREFAENFEEAAYERIDREGAAYFSVSTTAERRDSNALLSMMPLLEKSIMGCVNTSARSNSDDPTLRKVLTWMQGGFVGQGVQEQINLVANCYTKQNRAQ